MTRYGMAMVGETLLEWDMDLQVVGSHASINVLQMAFEQQLASKIKHKR